MDDPQKDEALPQPVTAPLPHDVRAPTLARCFLHQNRDGLPQALIENAELLTSELVTNAVLHGQPPIAMELAVTPTTLDVAIDDGGPNLPVLDTSAVSGTQPHGRGLQIVDTIANQWGVQKGPRGNGKRVWFRLFARSS